MPADPVFAELAMYEATGELLPGSAQVLSQAWSGLRNLPPERLAEEVANRLAEDTASGTMPGLDRRTTSAVQTLASQHRNPEYRGNPDAAPVRQALARRLGLLRDGAVDELTLKWGSELNHLSPGQIAAGVVKRLADPANGQYLKHTPAVPAWQQRFARIVGEHFPEVENASAFAAVHAKDFITTSDERQVVRAIATRLTLGANAHFLTGRTTLSKGDPRTTYNPPRSAASDRLPRTPGARL